MKVLYITNAPSPYRVSYFNKISSSCELTVVYENASLSNRDAKWKGQDAEGYKKIYLDSDVISSSKIIKSELNSKYDAVIICGIREKYEIIAILHCISKGIEYAIEIDGAFPNRVNPIKKAFKKHLLSNAKKLISTCEQNDLYYIYYNVDKSKIVRCSFSSVDECDVLPSPISVEEKAEIRKKLGINEDKIVISVGQFIKRKGFDILLKAAKDCKYTFYIVGGNPTEEYLSYVKQNGITNVRFVGFKTKDELKEYYKAADVFVLPTREDIWGLVVNEALAYALPVITTDRCNAGLELIKDGYNGYIVPTENSDEIVKSLDKIFSDLRTSSENALETAKKYTVERMAEERIKFINDLLNEKASD